jgi:hypothetical protein
MRSITFDWESIVEIRRDYSLKQRASGKTSFERFCENECLKRFEECLQVLGFVTFAYIYTKEHQEILKLIMAFLAGMIIEVDEEILQINTPLLIVQDQILPIRVTVNSFTEERI